MNLSRCIRFSTQPFPHSFLQHSQYRTLSTRSKPPKSPTKPESKRQSPGEHDGAANPKKAESSKSDADKNREWENASDETKLKMIREAEHVGQRRGIDIWAQTHETLDVQIPYKTAIWSSSKYGSLKERWEQWVSNQVNKGKNIFSMMRLVSYSSLPQIDLYTMGVLGVFRTPYHLFTSSSTKPTSWVAPMRKVMEESWLSIMKATASRDKNTLARLTQVPYYTEAEKLLKKSSMNTYFWAFHRHVSPPQIISLRAIEGHLGSVPPSFGNRLIIHALVRFESEQSLEIYSPTGVPLHTAESESSPSPSSSNPNNSRPRTGTKRVQAKKHILTEYYIFEKRMYMNTPWQIKERVYPEAGKEVKV